MSWIRDAMILAGIGAFGTGLYFYDWRLAAVGVGLILLIVGVGTALLGALRGDA